MSNKIKKILRLFAILFAMFLVTGPYLIDALEKTTNPTMRGIAAIIAVLIATFVNALKVPVFSQIVKAFLKEAGIEDTSKILPQQPGTAGSSDQSNQSKGV